MNRNNIINKISLRQQYVMLKNVIEFRNKIVILTNCRIRAIKTTDFLTLISKWLLF
jgi:hypothetical protein